MSKQIDAHTEKFIPENSLTEQECELFVEHINEIKSYVIQQRASGYFLSSADLADYVYDYAVSESIIASYNQVHKDSLISVVSKNIFSGDSSLLIVEHLYDTSAISSAVSDELTNFISEFSAMTSYSEGYAYINEFREGLGDSQGLTSNEISAFEEAMDAAEEAICYEEYMDAEEYAQVVALRDLCEECVLTINWVKVVITMVIAVVVWVLSFITFGLSSVLSAIISFTVWTAVWVLHCYFVECEQDPCPGETTPSCQGSFTYDSEAMECVNPNIPANAIWIADCFWVPRLPGGSCPNGSTDVGSVNCLLECFNPVPEGFGRNAEGEWRFNFECI